MAFEPYNPNSSFTPYGQQPVPEAKSSPFTSGPIGSLPGIKQLNQVGVGIGTEIGKAGLGLGQTFLKGAQAVSSKFLGTDPNIYNGAIQGIETAKQGIFDKPYQSELNSIPGEIGKGIGASVPFVETGGAITKGQEFLSGATKAKSILGSTKVIPYLVQKAAQIAPEIIGTAATQYAVSGGDKESAKTAGVVAGVISAITHVSSDAFRSIIPQTAKENATRALGIRGKISLADASAGQKVDNSVSALTTMSRLAPDIKVTGKDGVEKVFNPLKTDFIEMPQALYQAKNKIYEGYSALAKQAGDQGVNFTAKDFYAVIDDLNKYKTRGFTNAYSSKADQIVESLQRFIVKNGRGGSYFDNVDPAEIQKLIENINLDVNPLSDKAGAKVAGEASRFIREILDGKINQATGAEYQQLRNAYAQLKSIEPDVINQYKVALRKAGFASDFIDGLAVVDTLQGILTQSPTTTVRGSLIGGIKKIYQYLRDPEVNLQRAFQIINKGEGSTSGLRTRLLGPVSEKTGAFKAGQNLKAGAVDYAKNPKLGASIESITPELVAKKVDARDLGLIREYLRGGINADMRAQPMIKAMQLESMPEGTLKRFFKEVLALNTKKLTVKNGLSNFTKGERGLFSGSAKI